MLSARLWQDAEALAADEALPWGVLDGATVLVTGATGLIGKNLCAALVARRKGGRGPVRIIGTSRQAGAVEALFGGSVEEIHWDAVSALRVEGDLDFIVHTAAPTASRFFVEKPVETIESIIDGTRAVLRLSQEKRTRKTALLSSMEVYGETGDGLVTEGDLGKLDPMETRNSYPEAKRLSEALCCAYAVEYGVNALVLRLAQTFGPGVAKDDARVFAYFMRCALNGEDISLATDGSKSNPYVSTLDATAAVLYALAFGEPGEAYNVANEDTFTSVYEMAQLVAERFGGGIAAYRGKEAESGIYRKASSLQLDTAKMRALGWQPRMSLEGMYGSLRDDWTQENA